MAIEDVRDVFRPPAGASADPLPIPICTYCGERTTNPCRPDSNDTFDCPEYEAFIQFGPRK